MTEKAEKYRAISEMASLLRETTQKRLANCCTQNGVTPPYTVEYYNVVFDSQEHADVKRAFLKLCDEV